MAVSQMNGKASICANSAEPQENGRRGAKKDEIYLAEGEFCTLDSMIQLH